MPGARATGNTAARTTPSVAVPQNDRATLSSRGESGSARALASAYEVQQTGMQMIRFTDMLVGGARIAEVSFPRPFAEVPSVTLALHGLDHQVGAPLRIQARLREATPFGFTYDIYTWADTGLWRGYITWHAFVDGSPCQSQSIGWRSFDPAMNNVDSLVHPPAAGDEPQDVDTRGKFSIRFPAAYPVIPSVQVAFAGLDTAWFNRDPPNHRVYSSIYDVTHTGFRVAIGPWADSRLSGFELIWYTSIGASTCQLGAWEKIWWGTPIASLSSMETVWVPFPIPFTSVPRVSVALALVDEEVKENTRLSTEIGNVATTGFEIKINSWAGSKTYRSRLMWMAISRDCSRATQVTGRWAFLKSFNAGTFDGFTQYTEEIGTITSHEEQKSQEWISSVSSTISEGVSTSSSSSSEAGIGYGAFSFGIESTSSTSQSTSSSYSNVGTQQMASLATEAIQTTETTTTIDNFMGAGVLWQFIFDVEDQCGSATVLTKNIIATQGRFAPPCCLPGFHLDPGNVHGPCYEGTPCLCESSICQVPPPSPSLPPPLKPPPPIGMTEVQASVISFEVTVDEEIETFTNERGRAIRVQLASALDCDTPDCHIAVSAIAGSIRIGVVITVPEIEDDDRDLALAVASAANMLLESQGADSPLRDIFGDSILSHSTKSTVQFSVAALVPASDLLPSPENNDNQDASFPVAAAIGVGVATCAVIIALVFLIIYCRRKQMRMAKDSSAQETGN
eukprot:scaffold245700_cov32-Tisochrysis_lutea.AAC.1